MPSLGEAIAASAAHEALTAIGVSVTGGLVVALLTAPHPPPLVRALKRRLRRPPRRTASPISKRTPPPLEPKALAVEPGQPVAPPPVQLPEQVVVRLLGTIGVDGVLLRDKALAVLAYLAVHGKATADEIDIACWIRPSGGPGTKRVKDIISECRGIIGTQHLPPSQRGIYAVGPDLITDLDLFTARVDAADRQPGRVRAEGLERALNLVSGRIFRYPTRGANSYTWIDLEHLMANWEARIEAIALDCATNYADSGSTDKAIAVLLRMLEVLPLNVALTEALMRSHARDGDRSRVEAVYRAHLDGLERVHGSAPEPSTVQLRSELTAT